MGTIRGKQKHRLCFSRTIGSTLDTSTNKMQLLIACPTSKQIVSRERTVNKKRQRLPGHPPASQHDMRYHNWQHPDRKILIPFLINSSMPSIHDESNIIIDDRLTHVQILFTWNPSPFQSSKVSFEQLLLPPRSASANVPSMFTPWTSQQSQCPPTHEMQHSWMSIHCLLERHPFSGLVHSAGELLHTP